MPHTLLMCRRNRVGIEVIFDIILYLYRKTTEALEGHFSYFLQLICYILLFITYLLEII